MELDALRHWTPPEGWVRLTTLDAHTGGEPLRIIIDGFPAPESSNILARRRQVKATLDHLRTTLMWEPRGHREMYGCLITPAVSPGAHFGVLFLHNEGYSTMCGHGIIGVATVAVQTGLVPTTGSDCVLRIDTPAGLVTALVHQSGGQVEYVRFRNVPSFVVALDASVDVPGLGRVTYDLAFGGAFYAYVQAASVGLTCVKEQYQALVDTGMAIKRAVAAAARLQHPDEADLGFLYGTIFIGPPLAAAGVDSRNVCIFANGQVDRSPTGTGVSGRMAIHHARGEVGLDQPLVIESIVDSRFIGRVVETTTCGPYPAVVPEVEGRAFITGRHEFFIDPGDELGHGFILT